jgi:hypothetical protein
METAEREGAVPYDVKGVALGHHGQECSFEAILKKYKLDDNPALALLGKIVNGADTDNTLWQQPEGPGLEAIAEGFRHLGIETTIRSMRQNGLSTMRCMPTVKKWCGRENQMACSKSQDRKWTRDYALSEYQKIRLLAHF